MISKNSNIVAGAFTYAFFLLIVSFLIVSYSSVLHAPYLESDSAVMNDKAITKYLITGDEGLLPTMTEKEASHLKDVKRLLLIFVFVALLLLKATIFSWFNKSPFRKIRWYFPKSKEKLNKKDRLAIILTPFGLISFFTVAQIFLAAAFHEVFMGFHLLFFPQGNFLFPFDSVLITTYPETFFFSMMTLAFTLFVTFTALLGFIYIVNFIRRKN